MQDSTGLLFKTKMCSFFDAGVCAKGAFCTHAHCESELQKVPDLRKTAFCREWLRSGTCAKKNKCRFAHGENEIRPFSSAFVHSSSSPLDVYGSECGEIHSLRSTTGETLVSGNSQEGETSPNFCKVSSPQIVCDDSWVDLPLSRAHTDLQYFD